MLYGYNSLLYAKSLSEYGTVRELPKSGAWILKRKIIDTPYWDAMGCYPLFSCDNWSNLHRDIDELNGEIISLSLVTDPFGGYDKVYLQRCFNDIVSPFKDHFIVKLDKPLDSFISSHHLRNVKKGLKNVEVENCEKPIDFIKEWTILYQNLIEKFHIKGIARFSKNSFEKQLIVPGIIMFRAIYEDKTIGMLLWYIKDNVGYYHLGSFNKKGYEQNASFALFWTSIEYFKEMGINWLDLGSGAGLKYNGTDGLSRFKRGWSTETRKVYFCGHIFDQSTYSDIVEKLGISSTKYFPTYRLGEFE